MSPAHKKKIATIQVDVDPLWFIASLRNRQKPCRLTRTIYELAIPRFLELFADLGIKATFFVVGKDIEDVRNLPFMRQMLEAGHELANHTYLHRTDLRRMQSQELQEQIECAETLARAELDIRFSGFKSPAYGVTGDVIAQLSARGYHYDSSVCPNLAASAIKQFQRFVLRYRGGVSEFGVLRSALAPLEPYSPAVEDPYARGDSSLLEIPVSTVPLFRLPFHFSFINVLGFNWWRIAWRIWRVHTPAVLNYAFHAIDLLDTSDVPHALHWRPGLKLSREEKCCRARRILGQILSIYPVVTTRELAVLMQHNCDGRSGMPLKDNDNP